jgi:deferrochelatase/peroxidase EfeB
LTKRIQQGIYYDKVSEFKNLGNHSYAIVFLRVLGDVHASQVGGSLMKLWHNYESLMKGKVSDLGDSVVPNGELSVLIGYGPGIFKIHGVKKRIPKDFEGSQFMPANSKKPILDGAGIKYVNGNCLNLGTSEHIAIQFISKSQLASNRAVVETSENISELNRSDECLVLTKFYTGFQRDDGRSWLGFHDELSNMRDAEERKDAISIDRQYNQLIPDDFWTVGGTYMSFLRTEIDLGIWRKLGRNCQELIVGRDKITGRPLLGVDKMGNPISAKNIRKTGSVDKYDPRYSDHPDYFKKPEVSNKMRNRIDATASIDILSQSHIGRTRHAGETNSKNPTSRRIFRQGFEFIESCTEKRGSVKVGLNFVSFQNDPRRLFFILRDPRWLGNSNFGGPPIFSKNLLSVQASGMFLVPPVERGFPGYSIFQ